jgi:hypothetical protein
MIEEKGSILATSTEVSSLMTSPGRKLGTSEDV